MNIGQTPAELIRQVAEDELRELEALTRCKCLPSIFTRIAVKESFGSCYYIWRCQCCTGVVPAEEVEADTCDTRPAMVS